MIQTIRIHTTKGPDLAGEGLLSEMKHLLHITSITKIQTCKVYRLEGVTKISAKKLAEQAFSESLNQVYTINQPLLKAPLLIEIAYKPGVMNPEVGSILKSAQDLGINPLAADSSREYAFFGKVSQKTIQKIIKDLHLLNPTIEYLVEKEPKTLRISGKPGKTKTIPLRSMNEKELMNLSKDTLFLNREEMKTIQTYYQTLHNDPTDCELEVLAQTWSEHCVHKTFKADLIIDGKKKQPLMTRIKQTAKGFDERIISAFSDNSGVIDFYDGYGICAKVETHNSPSAIEPYGGAMTGSGGVFRDVLGTGQGAKVLASTDIFCFAPPDLPERDIPPGCLPPSYLLKKVVTGVRDYGNRVGIPTNNGSIHFHKDFRAKPTVAVGAFGIIKKSRALKKTPTPGDLILTLGGRTGRDGIHGATFSSGEMTDTTLHTSGAAVQIGNAIEEKRLIDAIGELSEKGLIKALTDCGAGGYSSAVGEMGEKTGARVQLKNVPLKYTGLRPWEIFLSESQERMIIAINPSDKKRLMNICKKYNVEASYIGEFTNTKHLEVFYEKERICNLSMDFLHNGLPRRLMIGKTTRRHKKTTTPTLPQTYDSLLKNVLSHGNVCSKEPIVRLYDHTVQGRNALAPFGGVALDGPNDGTVVKPFYDKPYGMVLTHGLNPGLHTIDPYWGSIWAITEAVSNFVAIGGELKNAALIDNFIWPFPDEESLADLDTSVDACTDMAKLLKLPFVSGKDSLSSTYRYPNGNVLKIPPVLLISVFGKIPDVTRTVSSDFKQTGSVIVLVGKQDLKGMGGSTYFDLTHHEGTVPKVDLNSLPNVFQRITQGIQQGGILSCHDISEGGILTALSEMCFGGGIGAGIDVSTMVKERPDFVLFNETAGTFLVEVNNEKTAEKLFRDVSHIRIGHTHQAPALQVFLGKQKVLDANIDDLKRTWQKPMKELFS